MRVLADREKGIVSVGPVTQEENALLQDILATTVKGSVLKYGGRGGAQPNDPADQRMHLTFSYGEGKEFLLIGTTDEDERAVRQIRDAIYFGGAGLLFLNQTEVDGKLSLNFTVGKCRVCDKPVISRVECEWSYCDACAARCEHQYERGAIHGGGVDIGVGEFCSICGRAKPKAEDEPEKPLYDQHIAAQEELGIRVVYTKLPGITPRMMKGLMEGTMKTVLVVEDNEDWSDIIRRGLEDKVLVMQAFTMEEAEDIFQRHPDLAVVLMDACVPGDRPNTMWLVRKMRETFKGPMIAISSDPDYRKELIRAGCDHESEKEAAAEKVLEIVGTS